ncbi:MAG: hypothetical protein RIQ59_181 [Bacteroidota bacterium]|jgi:hypothetical protein
MNNIFKILSVFAICIGIAACSSSSTDEPEALRDYATQYATDIAAIDTYINTHYLTRDADYNVSFDTLLPSSGHSSIRTDNAFQLKDTTVTEDGINYKIYFIKFREGTEKRPTQVDSVHVSYKGFNLLKSAPFDQAVTPTWFRLQEVITGWSHILPNFHTGTYTAGTGGNPTTFDNYGAGVMILPSGLAYYNFATGTISSYSPIIFSFKLHELRYRDQDGDGILSKDERKLDPSISSSIRWKENPATIVYKLDNTGAMVTDIPFLDTDGDGYANMYDIDDDGDHVLTRVEIKNPSGGLYLYNLIPDCSGSVTNPNRVRKHIDPACQ